MWIGFELDLNSRAGTADIGMITESGRRGVVQERCLAEFATRNPKQNEKALEASTNSSCFL